MTHNDNDEALRRLLRESSPVPPAGDVDWRALHARIQLRAAPLLHAPQPATWWQMLAGWSGRGIPLGAAAAAALIIALGTGLTRNASVAPASDDASAFVTIEEEFAADAPLLVADADSDQLIEAMLLYESEVW